MRKLFRHVGRVAAEKFRVFNAAARGVLARVVNGLGYYLRAEDALCVICSACVIVPAPQ